MKENRFFSGGNIAILLLTLVIIAGGIMICQRNNNPGVEISLAEERENIGNIYISGEVNNPGIYQVFDGDSLDNLIRAAGGIKPGADRSNITLSIVPSPQAITAQKISVNRAEVWLLEALPGVGQIKAQAIVDYREQNGLFRDVNELLNVTGFSETILDKIRDFVTVND